MRPTILTILGAHWALVYFPPLDVCCLHTHTYTCLQVQIQAQDLPPDFPTDNLPGEPSLIFTATRTLSQPSFTLTNTLASTATESADATSTFASASDGNGQSATGEAQTTTADEDDAGARPTVAVAVGALFGVGALVANL